MTKRKNRVRATKATNLVGRDMVMTDHGLEPVEAVKAQQAASGAVHAPQIMALSNQTHAPKRGTRELLRLYSDSPWLRAIVSKIARAVAETDWMLYARRDRKSGKYIMPGNIRRHNGSVRENLLLKALEVNDIDAIDDHPLLEMLERGTGNPRLSGFASVEVTQKHLDLTGEAFWLIEPDQTTGVPYAFWPLPPSWVTNLPTEANPWYELNVPGGVQVKIPISMIVPFIDPDPENPYGRGSGISKALDDEIQIDEFAAKHAKSFFLNRARPDIIISGQFISPKDSERLEKQWVADHQGFWKSFKPLFFSQKIDVKELSQTFESMQMVQIRKHERDTFINVFGAPPEKFGIVGESKRSTINAADYFWNKDIIKPRIEMIRRMIQQVLVPRFDERLLLYYDTPVIQDEEFKLNAMKLAPHAVTVNEWRKVQGFDSLGPAGDVLVVPMNHMIIAVNNGDNKPISAPEVVEEAARQREAAKFLPAPTSDTRGLAEDIAREVVSAVEAVLTHKPRPE